MVSIQFTEEERQTLDRERFDYPDPRGRQTGPGRYRKVDRDPPRILASTCLPETLGNAASQNGDGSGACRRREKKEQREFLEGKLNPRIDDSASGSRKRFFVDASPFVHGAFLCCVWTFVRLCLKTPSGRKRFNVLGALD